MANNETLNPTTRELHERTSDGMHIRLMWNSDSNEVFVSVNDQKTGESFNVPVPEGERPMYVFAHPCAFAAGERAVAASMQA